MRSHRVRKASKADGVSPLVVEVDLIVESDLPSGADLARLASLVQFACGQETFHGAWSIAVVLTADARVQELHRMYMGIDEPTDVMTFPVEPVPGAELGGDIVVSTERAAEQAADYRHTAWEEIRFLTVHGVLHLGGWDDHDPAERARMLYRQQAIIEEFDRLPVDVGGEERAP